MPYNDHAFQLRWLKAWRVKNAEEIRKKKHQYYLSHRAEFAARRKFPNVRAGSREGVFETEKLRSSRALARWRDVPGESRLPVRVGRPRRYVGTALERRGQSLRIYRAKKQARQVETVGEATE